MNGFVFDSTEYPVTSKNLFDETENVRKNVKKVLYCSSEANLQ